METIIQIIIAIEIAFIAFYMGRNYELDKSIARLNKSIKELRDSQSLFLLKVYNYPVLKCE